MMRRTDYAALALERHREEREREEAASTRLVEDALDESAIDGKPFAVLVDEGERASRERRERVHSGSRDSGDVDPRVDSDDAETQQGDVEMEERLVVELGAERAADQGSHAHSVPTELRAALAAAIAVVVRDERESEPDETFEGAIEHARGVLVLPGHARIGAFELNDDSPESHFAEYVLVLTATDEEISAAMPEAVAAYSDETGRRA